MATDGYCCELRWFEVGVLLADERQEERTRFIRHTGLLHDKVQSNYCPVLLQTALEEEGDALFGVLAG
jgi:hypothetical protein